MLWSEKQNPENETSQKTVQIFNIRNYSHICYSISLTEAILELYDISLQVKVSNIMTLTKFTSILLQKHKNARFYLVTKTAVYQKISSSASKTRLPHIWFMFLHIAEDFLAWKFIWNI